MISSRLALVFAVVVTVAPCAANQMPMAPVNPAVKSLFLKLTRKSQQIQKNEQFCNEFKHASIDALKKLWNMYHAQLGNDFTAQEREVVALFVDLIHDACVASENELLAKKNGATAEQMKRIEEFKMYLAMRWMAAASMVMSAVEELKKENPDVAAFSETAGSDEMLRFLALTKQLFADIKTQLVA